MHYTVKVRKTPPPHPVLFKLFDEEPGGVRPEAFVEPRPQERVQRHVVEHTTDLVRVAPMVPARQLIHVVCLWPAQLGRRRHG